MEEQIGHGQQGHSHSGHNDHGHSHEHPSDSHSGHNDHGHSHSAHSHGQQPNMNDKQRRDKLHQNWDIDEDSDGWFAVWRNAILSTLAISAAPFVILFFIPLDNSVEKENLLKVLLGFASGGLLGDAFLHLIPHAMMASGDGSTAHGHSHDQGGGAHDMSVGLGVLGGFISFLIVEKCVHIFGSGHSHSSSTGKQDDDQSIDERGGDKSSSSEETVEDATCSKPVCSMVDDESAASSIKVSGYLNLFADTFHNFTDGLAIGSSFLAGHTIGLVTVFTILFHEIPHEIGDFAILIRSGVPPRKAMLLQLVTAVGALAGCVLALVVGGSVAGTGAVILPFTAGGFIYIATVSVIPELISSTSSSILQSSLEILAMMAGILMMVIIAQFE